MKYTVKFTVKFKKDYKLALKRGYESDRRLSKDYEIKTFYQENNRGNLN